MNELNEAGNKIGYWERYYSNGELSYKGNYSDDGIQTGYWERYNSNGNLWYKKYYIS